MFEPEIDHPQRAVTWMCLPCDGQTVPSRLSLSDAVEHICNVFDWSQHEELLAMLGAGDDNALENSPSNTQLPSGARASLLRLPPSSSGASSHLAAPPSSCLGTPGTQSPATSTPTSHQQERWVAQPSHGAHQTGSPQRDVSVTAWEMLGGSSTTSHMTFEASAASASHCQQGWQASTILQHHRTVSSQPSTAHAQAVTSCLSGVLGERHQGVDSAELDMPTGLVALASNLKPVTLNFGGMNAGGGSLSISPWDCNLTRSASVCCFNADTTLSPYMPEHPLDSTYAPGAPYSMVMGPSTSGINADDACNADDMELWSMLCADRAARASSENEGSGIRDGAGPHMRPFPRLYPCCPFPLTLASQHYTTSIQDYAQILPPSSGVQAAMQQYGQLPSYQPGQRSFQQALQAHIQRAPALSWRTSPTPPLPLPQAQPAPLAAALRGGADELCAEERLGHGLVRTELVAPLCGGVALPASCRVGVSAANKVAPQVAAGGVRVVGSYSARAAKAASTAAGKGNLEREFTLRRRPRARSLFRSAVESCAQPASPLAQPPPPIISHSDLRSLAAALVQSCASPLASGADQDSDAPLGSGSDCGTGMAASLTMQDLRPLFHLSLKDAATQLGVGVSQLKKQCRALGVPSWPHRKLTSLAKLHHNVAHNDDLTTQQKTLVLARIHAGGVSLQMDPTSAMDPALDTLREATYKCKSAKQTGRKRPLDSSECNESATRVQFLLSG